MIVDRKGNLPELEVRGIDVFEAMGPFLLDHLLQNAHVFGLQDLDRERVVRQVTVNETVEA